MSSSTLIAPLTRFFFPSSQEVLFHRDILLDRLGVIAAFLSTGGRVECSKEKLDVV